MILKSIKTLVIAGLGLLLVGGVLFGTEFGSYLRCSARSVQSAIKDAVPIEFELKRARDLLNDIIPEMQANIRLIAQQEVEIASLKTDIAQSQKALTDEQARVQKLRDCLATSQVSFTFSGVPYSRQELKEELARRFDRYKEAEVVMAGKRRLMENRDKALAAGMQMLDRTRSQKAMLENQIESLAGQFRLVQAASVGTGLSLDNSKLAQTEKLIAQIKKQLDVAERVLAHEAKFTQPMQVEVIDEDHLVAEVDEHFTGGKVENDRPGREHRALSQADASQPASR
jgi:hypothetical protein